MNNVWPVALRLPCAAFYPPASSQPWALAARIATGRSFPSIPVLRYNPQALLSHNTSPIISPSRLRNSLNSFSRSFSTSSHVYKEGSSGKPALTPPTTKSTQIRIPPLPINIPAPEFQKLFGTTISPNNGNKVLRVLHHRRVTGSLAEEGVRGIGQILGLPQVTNEMAMTGLTYLREKIPIDEETAAAEWAEAEATRVEQEYWASQGLKLGIYKEMDREESQQGTAYGRERYGESRIEAIRKKNEAKWEVEKKEREAKLEAEKLKNPPRELRMVNGEPVPPPKLFGYEITTSRAHESPWLKKYREKAQVQATSLDELRSRLTTFQRIWPTALFTVSVCTLCAFFAVYYEPPANANRLFPDIKPSVATALTILSINAAFLLLWRFPPAWPFMNKYMTSLPSYPRAFAALGNVFSHQSFKHFGTNMLWLMTIGVWAHDIVGRGVFLGTYLAAGTVGSFASLSYYALTRNFTSSSTGASGAIMAILALFCLTDDRDKITIPFTSYETAFHPRLVLCIAIALEIFNLRFKRMGNLDHYSHLGGYATGIVAAGLWRYWESIKGVLGLEEEGDVMRRVEGKEMDKRDVVMDERMGRGGYR